MNKDIIKKLSFLLNINPDKIKYHHIYLCKIKHCQICSVILCPQNDPYHLLYLNCPSCSKNF